MNEGMRITRTHEKLKAFASNYVIIAILIQTSFGLSEQAIKAD